MEDRVTVDIHPNGDVILLCGDEEYHGPRPLRVSSVLLAHASPVFKAMLGPHFSEGNTLAASSSVEIPLREDDPDAMEAICLVLHMRNGDALSRVTANELLMVANHCNKYDVFVATRPVINMWLEACLESSMDYGTAVELIAVAFHLKLWRSVGRLGIIMVQKGDHDISGRHEIDSELPQMPLYIYDQLEMHRRRTLCDMYSAIEGELDRYLYPEKLAGKCGGDCEGINTRKLQLVTQLRERRLWPAKRIFGRSLVSIRDSLSTYGLVNAKPVKKCQPEFKVGSVKSAYQHGDIFRRAMTETLDKMTSEITFDSSEENGMVLGFVGLG